MKRIMHFHDFITYPNQGNIEVIEGGGEAIFPGSGERHFYPETGLHSLAFADDHPGIHDPEYLPLGNWNVLSISLRWKTYEAPPYAHDDPLRDTKARDWAGGLLDQMVIPMPRVRDFELLIDLDASTATRIKDLQLQRELEFILGERDISEWDAYIEEWKQAGGEELMQVAAEQLGASMP